MSKLTLRVLFGSLLLALIAGLVLVGGFWKATPPGMDAQMPKAATPAPQAATPNSPANPSTAASPVKPATP